MTTASEDPPRRLLTILLLALLLILSAGGFVVWTRFNPFFDHTAQYRDALALQTAVRQRPLTAEEMDRCLALCEIGDGPARQSALATAEAAVGRTPEYKPLAVEALTRVSQAGDAPAKAAAAAILKRLTAPPSGK